MSSIVRIRLPKERIYAMGATALLACSITIAAPLPLAWAAQQATPDTQIALVAQEVSEGTPDTVADASESNQDAAQPHATTPDVSKTDREISSSAPSAKRDAVASSTSTEEESVEVPSVSAPATQAGKTGFENRGSATFYYEGGNMASGERCINGAWYYFDPQKSGAAAKSAFVFLPDAHTERGGKWVYYGSDGKMLYGQQNVNGRWYLFDKRTGAVTYGFVYIAEEAKWVFYDRTMGWMLYGQQNIDNHWYLFDQHTGAVTYGFVYIADQKKWVFYDRTMGWMLYGQQNVNGRWYLFDHHTGAVTYGFVYIPDQKKWVFYDRTMGWMLYGQHYLDDAWYYLDDVTGAVTYGLVFLADENKIVYYDTATGRMVKGPKTIGNLAMNFDQTTGAITSHTFDTLAFRVKAPNKLSPATTSLISGLKSGSIRSVRIIGDSISAGYGAIVPIYTNGPQIFTNGYGGFREVSSQAACYANSVRRAANIHRASFTNASIALKSAQWYAQLESYANMQGGSVGATLIMLGTNDFASNASQFEQDMRTVIKKAKGSSANVYVASPIPQLIEDNAFTLAQRATIIDSVCAQEGVTYVDLYHDFTNTAEAAGISTKELYKDNVHPNVLGQVVIWSVVSQRLGL